MTYASVVEVLELCRHLLRRSSSGNTIDHASDVFHVGASDRSGRLLPCDVTVGPDIEEHPRDTNGTPPDSFPLARRPC